MDGCPGRLLRSLSTMVAVGSVDSDRWDCERSSFSSGNFSGISGSWSFPSNPSLNSESDKESISGDSYRSSYICGSVGSSIRLPSESGHISSLPPVTVKMIEQQKLVSPRPPSTGRTTAKSPLPSSTLGNSGAGKRSGWVIDKEGDVNYSKKKKKLGIRENGRRSPQISLIVSPELRNNFEEEKSLVRWISHSPSRTNNQGTQGRHSSSANYSNTLAFDSLIIGRKVIKGEYDIQYYVKPDFCDAQLIRRIIQYKYTINGEKLFLKFRQQLNEFENIPGMWLTHGNAIVMANIDSIMDFQLSNPRNAMEQTLLKPIEPLYFVDIYGAPGGTTEYLLWKKQWFAHGIGFASKTNDWNLNQKPHFPVESFDSYYGFYNHEGKGDIYNPVEVQAFIKYVMKSTANEGAHVGIAQGGELEIGNEDSSEIRCKYLFLSEVLIGLSTVREGGHFVMKIFDMMTPFMVGLFYLLYRTFETVSIYKPETSLIASPERYILCKYKKPINQVTPVCKFLTESLRIFFGSQQVQNCSKNEIANIDELVPVSELKKNLRFCEHVLQINNELGELQLRQASELIYCLRSEDVDHNAKHVIQNRLKEIWEKATSLWGISSTFKLPGKYRSSEGMTPEIRFSKLIGPYTKDILESILREGEQILNLQNMKEELTCPHDWNFVLVGKDRGFYLSLGGDQVYKYVEGKEKGEWSWQKLTERVELSNNTLVYGDLVEEIQIFEEQQRLKVGFHIIDGILLGGKDIRSLPFSERWELCDTFARSMNKPDRNDVAAVRVKTQHRLQDLPTCIALMTQERLLRSSGGRPSRELICPLKQKPIRGRTSSKSKFFKPSGLSMFRTGKGGGIAGDASYCLQNRLYWEIRANVKSDPKFTESEWHNVGEDENDKEEFRPILADTFISFLKDNLKNN